MILFKSAILVSVLITIIHAECPVTENPVVIFDCLGFITRGLYGVVIKDVDLLCSVARDIANCTQQHLGDCIAAEIGRATLNEITNIASNCCPDRNFTKCPLRDELLNEQRCFAVDSFVTLANGKPKTIAKLQSGDEVLAYDDKTKQIISTHVITMLDNQPNQFAIFKQLTTISGQQLSLTSSHLLPTDIHGYVMAKDIRIGMNIYIMNNNNFLTTETISNVIDIVKQGYIAPLTQEGTLIVNHVAASCYATINNHYLAHAVLAPMRWWYSLFGEEKESNEIIGIHWFSKMLYEITIFFVPSIIQK